MNAYYFLQLIVSGDDGNMAHGVRLVVELKEETLALSPYMHEMVDEVVLDEHLWLKLVTLATLGLVWVSLQTSAEPL